MYETEIREVDKEKKRIKIHYKGFSEDTDEMSGVTMVLYLTSKDFTLCPPSAPQIHYSKFRINISVRFSIHSTTLPVIFLLPCSHVYKPFAVLKTTTQTTSLTPDSSKIHFTTAAVVDS